MECNLNEICIKKITIKLFMKKILKGTWHLDFLESLFIKSIFSNNLINELIVN